MLVTNLLFALANEIIDFSETSYKFLRSFISQALQGNLYTTMSQAFNPLIFYCLVDSGHLRPKYDYRPQWWPGNIRFISPNHPPGIVSKIGRLYHDRIPYFS